MSGERNRGGLEQADDGEGMVCCVVWFATFWFTFAISCHFRKSTQNVPKNSLCWPRFDPMVPPSAGFVIGLD